MGSLLYKISDLSACLSSPCMHGTCIVLINSYRCQCEPGYTGTNCEKGDKDSNVLSYSNTESNRHKTKIMKNINLF